jgi:hypothetical protein
MMARRLLFLFVSGPVVVIIITALVNVHHAGKNTVDRRRLILLCSAWSFTLALRLARIIVGGVVARLELS